MSDALARQDGGLPAFADDALVYIAEQAEKRIDAVIRIKQAALKVTNPRDWVDQNGNPYLQVSGAEKVAGLFNISWRIDEPVLEEEPDGTVTYTYKGEFSMAGRTIEAEGSRSSRDEFFRKYFYDDKGVRQGEKPLDRRDLKMAAFTNLLGNGITRILGIRNLTYEDLEKFAGIKKADIRGVEYKDRKGGNKRPVNPPAEKKAGEPSAREKLKAELEAYCGEDSAMMEDVVRQCSYFESNGKDYSFGLAQIFEQKEDGSMRVSDHWIGNTLNSLREMVKAG